MKKETKQCVASRLLAGLLGLCMIFMTAAGGITTAFADGGGQHRNY